jgi:hypothetical protein
MGLQQPLRGYAGTDFEVGVRNRAHTPDPDHDRTMKTYFDHGRLNAYQEAIAFCGWVGDLLNEIIVKAVAEDQLDRASTGIPLNITEGNGKFSERAEVLREDEAAYLIEHDHEHE